MLILGSSIFHNNVTETFSFFKRNKLGFNGLKKSTTYIRTSKTGYTMAEDSPVGKKLFVIRKVYTKNKGYNEDNVKKKHAFL